MALDLALAAVLLLAPLLRDFFEERRVHQPVKLVDLHGVNAIVQSIVLGLMPLDRFLVLTALVGMAGVQRLDHPFQHLVIEAKPPEKRIVLPEQRSSPTADAASTRLFSAPRIALDIHGEHVEQDTSYPKTDQYSDREYGLDVTDILGNWRESTKPYCL